MAARRVERLCARVCEAARRVHGKRAEVLLVHDMPGGFGRLDRFRRWCPAVRAEVHGPKGPLWEGEWSFPSRAFARPPRERALRSALATLSHWTRRK